MVARGQVYGIVTYDALFKWVLDDSSIRPSFFHAFIPEIGVQSSERIDEHMKPWEELQNLRKMINSKSTTDLVASIKGNGSSLSVHVDDRYHKDATEFVKAVLHHFDDICYSFPEPRFDGTMDFVCRLKNEELALVEMQITPEDCWDQRALAYAAALYGNQLRQCNTWKEIRKVIGINILGGGMDDKDHWKGDVKQEEFPPSFVRHYKFQDQLNGENPPRFLEGIEIIQYSLARVPAVLSSQEQKDWLRLLKSAHHMTEADVKKEIKTPAVLKAFERAKFVNLPEAVKVRYDSEDKRYVNQTKYIERERAEGKVKV